MREYELNEHRHKHNPSEFVASMIRNEYVNFGALEVYLRKGPIAIDGEIKTAIQLSNVSNPRRIRNIKTNPKHKKTGKFSALMKELKKLAKENGYDGVYVESIQNEFLPDVLERYGYSQVNIDAGTINYWKTVSSN